MTIKEALVEIERKHPNYLWHWQQRKKYKPIPKIQTAYWFYQWKRNEYGSYYISESNDEYWQLL